MTLDVVEVAALGALAGAALSVFLGGRTRRKLEKLNDGPDDGRIAVYLRLTLSLTLMGAVILSPWVLTGRELAELGFRYETSWRFWGTSAVVALVGLFYWGVLTQLALSAAMHAESSELVRRNPAVKLFPRSPKELRFWTLCAASTAAEEIFYRGFILWYLARTMDVAAAGVLSCVLFGAAHAYQGARGMLRTGVMGVVFLATYLTADSLWPAIALHVIQDLFAGTVGYLSLRAPPEPAAATRPV